MEQLESRYLLTAFDVLVFSKTSGFRHGSIPTGIAAIESLGTANDFSVTATENANHFTAANLANYEAIVFLNTINNVLNSSQEAAMEQYIQNGGGFVGVHSAAGTEPSWGWYGDLVGARFQSHPAIQQATVVVTDQTHPSTAHLPQQWVRTDEWFNYQSNPRGSVNVLATLDESTYSGGVDGADHPIAWYHDFDGGRSWYTGLGHTNASYAETNFLDHLLGGITYAAGQNAQTVSADFNQDGDTDGADFLQWQRGFGITSNATRNDGDANIDGKVDAADLGVWQTNFASSASLSALLSTPPNDIEQVFAFPESVTWKPADGEIFREEVVDFVVSENPSASVISAMALPSDLLELAFDFQPSTDNSERAEASLDLAFADFKDVASRLLS